MGVQPQGRRALEGPQRGLRGGGRVGDKEAMMLGSLGSPKFTGVSRGDSREVSHKGAPLL